ncbi:MAG: GlxA family transcriptional regulator [Verrucomicrobia bacterium]|nr:GlxA family transcriptional regulator [Verrucomicrobiota bacterium]
MTRKIGFLVFPQFQILDLTGPLAAFEMPSRNVRPKPYRLQVVSEFGGLVKSSSGLAVATERIGTSSFDTVIAVGGLGTADAARSLPVKAFVRKAAKTCRRVTSVCSGTFILAAAGLLNGLRVTTHWRAATLLQKRYPDIHVECDRIFVKQGSIWTAAGVTAGIDLALALIEEDLGPEVAKAAARDLVVYYRRPGGQSQFSALLDLEATSERVQNALSYARAHLGKVRSVEQLAKAAGLSPRQFGRLFLAETGQTPAKAIEKLRAEMAKARIEDSDEPIETIARTVGFSDPERMRRAFVRTYGHPPQTLRRIARGLPYE